MAPKSDSSRLMASACAGGAFVALAVAALLQRPEAGGCAPLREAHAQARRQLEAALEDKAAVLRQLEAAREWSSTVVARSERQQASCREAQESVADLARETRELRWQLRAAGAGAGPPATALPSGVPAQIGADGCEICPLVAAPPSGALARLGHSGTTMLSGVAKEVVAAAPSGAARPTGADDVTLSLTVRHAGGVTSRRARVELPLHLAGERLGPHALPLALGSMGAGERARFLFAAETGYGATLGVPPRATVEVEVELHAVAEVEELSTDGTKAVLKRVLSQGKGSETPAAGATVTIRLGAPRLEDSLVGAAAALTGAAEGIGPAAGSVAVSMDDSRAVGEALRLALHSMRR